jgi:NTE family protein
MVNIHKVVFIVVNAQTEIDSHSAKFPKIPGFSAMLDSYSSIAIGRYNMETLALLRESFPRWANEIRKGRCEDRPSSTEPGGCGDIEFYAVEVRFDILNDEAESHYLKRLPTSFALKPEEVDRLRAAARQILAESEEFQRLVHDMQ